MPAQEKGRRGRKLVAVTALALLILLSAADLRIVKGPLQKFIQHDLGFEDLVDEIQEGYLSGRFAHKTDFLNLNGLFARSTGRRMLNGVVRLNNGMLSMPINDMDITGLANGIVGFSAYLSEQDIPFLYVQLPDKDSLDGQSYPVGVHSYGNKIADDLLFQLSAGGVESLDLRPLMSQTPELLERYFSKTDHHWNNDGSFLAFQEIVHYLHGLFPEGDIDLTYAQADRWDRHSIDDWFLGSRGKRVGIFFGGTDPLIWYTPRFETEMSCAVPGHGWLYRGDFTEANIRTRYIEEKQFFDLNAYVVYTGGDYPLVQHRNLGAPSPLKVIMLRDSFTLPLQAYLSTVFQEIDVIDPRYFSECAIAEYVEWAEPDVVILSMYPGVFKDGSYQDYGLEGALSIGTEEGAYELVDRRDIEVKASGGDQDHAAYPLDADTVYRVSFEGVDILEGQTEGVGLRLYDKTAETVLGNMIFDLAYCEAANGFSWTFRTPDAQNGYELLFYAGIYDSTAGNGVIYRNATLEKLRSSDP